MLSGDVRAFRHLDGKTPAAGQVWVVWPVADSGDAEVEIPVVRKSVTVVEVDGTRTEQRAVTFAPSLPLPFATRINPRNEMSVGQRLFWIAAIAIGSAFSAGMYLAGLESLSRMLRG